MLLGRALRRLGPDSASGDVSVHYVMSRRPPSPLVMRALAVAEKRLGIEELCQRLGNRSRSKSEASTYALQYGLVRGIPRPATLTSCGGAGRLRLARASRKH